MSAAPDPAPTTAEAVLPTDDGADLCFRARGVDLARYRYLDRGAQLESPRPHLHPLRTLDGDVVTAWRPWDHRWHRGVSLALPHVGETNFWGGPTFVRGRGYVQLDNNGTTEHVGFGPDQPEAGHDGSPLPQAPGAEGADVVEHLRWRDARGRTVVTERRALSVRLLDERAWVLEVGSSWRNVSGQALALGSPATNGRPDACYGGWFWRGPREFVEGDAFGPEGPLTMGARAPWAAYAARHDEVDRSSTVVMVSSEPDHEHGHGEGGLPWFVRTEPFPALGPAPYAETEDVVDDGATRRSALRLVVACGSLGGDAVGDLLDGLGATGGPVDERGVTASPRGAPPR